MTKKNMIKHTPEEYHCDYCGDLTWTISHWGRKVHKDSCPARGDDPLHQGNIYHMIAAALDLLKACKLALTDLEPYEWTDLVDFEESGGYAVKATIDKLRAAISKAEGVKEHDKGGN